MALCAGLVFSGCKKDEEENNEPQFSSNTVEQNKAIIENSGTNLLTNLSDIKDASAFIALTKLSVLLQDENKSASNLCLLNNLKAFSEGKATEGFDVSSINTYIANYQGVYTYDETTQSFTKTEATNKVEFIFPYDASSTCNFKVNVAYGSNPSIPNSITSTMKIDNLQVLSLTFSAEFSENLIPTMLAEALTIDDYTMGMELSRTNTNADIDYFINKGTTTLMKYTTALEGDMSDNTLISAYSNQNTTAEGESTDESSDFEEIEQMSNIVSKITLSAQIMDIKLVASADTKEIVEIARQAEQFEDNDVPPSKAQMDDICTNLNNTFSCYAMQVSENARIANIKFFSAATEDYGVSYYEPEPRFEFGDNTTSTFDAYFETDEFKNLASQYQQFFMAFAGPETEL